ncbi:MAG: GAF domain-containing protein [Sphingomicrobium sp.]
MKDAFAVAMADLGDSPEIRLILAEVCAVTGMGFAAVARVTEDRWIVCQVEDKIAFGLNPGDELAIKQTICDEIRDRGEAIFIDDVTADPDWRMHAVPILYGFKSYASLPLVQGDGSFFGTLCTIDPEPHSLRTAEMVEALRAFAIRLSAILSASAGANASAYS